MKATFKHQYKTVAKSGARMGQPVDVYVYTVAGTPAELKAYKTACKDRFVEDDKGTPLYFTTKVLGRSIELGISTKSGNVFANTSEADNIANLANQYPGVLGQEIARQGASVILAKLGHGSATQVEAETAPGVAKKTADLSKS